VKPFSSPSIERLFASLQSRARAAEPAIDRVLATPWVSYLLIAVLQAKVLWGIWKYRDLTNGDSSSYFGMAYGWSDNYSVNLLFSPLYTSLVGSLQNLTGDVYTTVTAHRIIIVMAATLLFLALMRRLLPASIALLLAAWWAVLPINFNVLYEIHLFSLACVMAAWLVAASDTPLARGSALAMLLAAAVLVRTELSLGAVAFALVCLWREAMQWRHTKAGEPFWRERIKGYALPMASALMACFGFYTRSVIKYPEILGQLHHKHAFNMCQLYAFSYWQRHPEWSNHNPWLDCPELMEQLFNGNPEPTLWQMVTINPAALFEHFLFNCSLILGGIQLALFNAVSGSGNPDFNPIPRSPAVLIPTLIVAAIVVFGAIKLVRHGHDWWPNWLGPRRGVWLAMLAVLCIAFPIILTQRPRPSYLFPATVVMMAAIGTCLYVLLAGRAMIAAKLAAMIGVPLLLLAVPPYFSKHRSDRPILVNYQRLLPFAGLLRDKRNRILIGDYDTDLINYGKLKGVTTMDYSLLASEEARRDLLKVLDAQRINVVFAQPRVMGELRAQPQMRQLIENPEAAGWKRLAPPEGDTNWLLLYREPRP
jgi:hypothetical protein